MKSGYGTRLIPDGTITGAHFVKSADFVQITGARLLHMLRPWDTEADWYF